MTYVVVQVEGLVGFDTESLKTQEQGHKMQDGGSELIWFSLFFLLLL